MNTYNEHNPLAPWNEIETTAEVVETYENLSEALESGWESEIILKQSQAIEDLKELIYALESVESGLTGKAKRLLQLIS